MSRQQHERQNVRARPSRGSSKFDRRSARNRTIILAMAILMALSLVAIPLGAALSGDSSPTPEDEAASPEDTVGPCGATPEDVPAITSAIYDEPFETSIDVDATYRATLVTTCGDLVIDLDSTRAPVAANNFVNLAEDGYYDGVVFHRVVPGFVIQAGDPAGTGCGQDDCANFDPDGPSFPGYDFADELTGSEALYEDAREASVEQLRAAAREAGEDVDEALFEQVPGGYPRGTVAMANAGPDTNGSQFFIAQGEPTALPGPDYTVLGTVVEGMDVVDDIAASPTDPAGLPFEPVAIREVTIEAL